MHTGLGLPQDHMFTTAPTGQEWREQLSGQTRLTVGPEDALQVVRVGLACCPVLTLAAGDPPATPRVK